MKLLSSHKHTHTHECTHDIIVIIVVTRKIMIPTLSIPQDIAVGFHS